MGQAQTKTQDDFQTMVVANDLRSIIAPKEAILAELHRHGYSECDVFALKLALEEALTNAVKHGNANDPNKKVTVRYLITPEKAEIMVRDEGSGFLPEDVPDCTCAERLPVPSGRGIMLMKAYMDIICYRDQGREVYVMKRRTGEQCGCDEGQGQSKPLRRTVYFSGNVQGVGFRFNAEALASKFTVTGYVRNLPDRRVELVAEGDQSELDRFLKAVQESMNRYIKSVEAHEQPATCEFLSFRISR